MKEHHYAVTVNWIGNTGEGTASYTAYQRDFNVEAPGKAPILGSADPAFRGDPERWNPEDMLLARSRPATSFGIFICAQSTT